MILLADSESPDQTARMRRLIWTFAVRICPKTRFGMARPIFEIESPGYDASPTGETGCSGFEGVRNLTLTTL